MLSTKVPRFFFGAHSKFAIIGGGTGGLNVSAHLRKEQGIKDTDIRVFEPNSQHAYQPAWTMVAGDIYGIEKTVKLTRDLIPKNIPISQLSVQRVDPENNTIYTEDGDSYTYDYLIVATGINLNYDAIKGATEALEDPNSPVGSAYHKPYAVKQQKVLQNFQGGTFLLHEPPMPIKCAGAPQKVAFLTDCALRKKGIRDQSTVQLNMAKGVIFGIPKYSEVLKNIHQEKNININLNQKMIEVKKDERIAIFENTQTGAKSQVKYDALHIVPNQVPPSFIKESGLADESGFVSVDIHTLQHKKFKNVFSLGDSANLPTSKTAAAIFSQTPVLINNLLVQAKHPGTIPEIYAYEGYTSCPILIGGNKLVLAEFKYNNVVDETFPVDQGKPQNIFFRLKKDIFPFVYWNLVCRGKWYGRKHILPNIPGYNRFFKPTPAEQ